LAHAGVGEVPQALTSLERAALVGGRFDHPLSAMALLEQGRLALDGGDVGGAAQLFAEASRSGFVYEDVGVIDEAVRWLAVEADGDARRALNVLEAAAEHAGPGSALTAELLRDAMQRRVARYDKSGEEHYNLISAYHKALRGSDPQGALYWLARMIDGGEDPMYIARRTIRFASEDVGLADPQALRVALAARDAYKMLGSPEGELALAEAAVYLATAPKSNRVYMAWGAALEAAREYPAEGVPLHIRNAPTSLMKQLGYGKGYQYAHDVPDAYLPQQYLPYKNRIRQFIWVHSVNGV
jgi:putative ATPase